MYFPKHLIYYPGSNFIVMRYISFASFPVRKYRRGINYDSHHR